jgi:RNA polymerase sigma-70 factor (ECF subfamily)
MQTEDEQELIRRLQSGEPDAVDQFYDLHFDRLYRHIYHQVHQDHAAAEDVMQETFMAALRGIARFRRDASLKTWLYSIAGHKIADWHRRQARRGRQSLSPAASQQELRKLDQGPLPDEIVQKKETRAVVRAALAQLPVHYRRALVLKYVEAYSVREISQDMGKSYKSIESLLVRARKALREALAQKVEQRDDG